MLTIGLVGHMCTGKSFVLKIFAELGCFAATADAIASELLFSENSRLHPQLIDLFGTEISNGNGKIDQVKLRHMIFYDPGKRRIILDRVIPLETEEMEKLVQKVAELNVFDFFVYESAYLIESGNYRSFDRLVVTSTSKKEQIERLIKRDYVSYTEAELFVNQQSPLDASFSIAHYTIDTSGTFEQTRNRTAEVFHQLQDEITLSRHV